MTMRGFVVVLTLLFGATSAGKNTCTSCETAKAGALKSGSDAAAKCTAFKDYIHCLASTDNTSVGCPLEETKAKIIRTFDDGTNCVSSALTDTCKCQKIFWGHGGNCSYIPVLKNCTAKLTSTDKGCDGSTALSVIFSKAQTRCGLPSTVPPPHGSATRITGTSESTTEKSTGGRISDKNCLTATLLMSLLGIFFM